jgi:hypothetical protein
MNYSDYDAIRSYPEGSYPYAAASYGPQPGSSSATAPGYAPNQQQNPMGYSVPQSRTPYDQQSGPYLNVGSTPIPEVTRWHPQSGPATTRLFVTISSMYELMTSSTPIFYLGFGNRKCQATLTKLSQQGAVCMYNVTTEVPDFAATGGTSSQVSVNMLMESGDGDVIATVEVGKFGYVSAAHNDFDTSQDASRKRKISDGSPELIKSPIKRSSSQMLRPKEEYSGTYGYSNAQSTSSFSPYMQPAQPYTNAVSQYSRPMSGYSAQPPRHLGYGYSNASNASPPAIKAQSPQVGNWSPAYGSVVQNIGRNNGVSSNGSLSRSSLPSPGMPANPPLIRTSTLQQTPSPGAIPHGGHHGQTFAPYGLYPSKAKLEINGNIDSMAEGWSEDEWEAKRRLVVFRRSQSGSTISTTFQAVTPEERPPQSICISCIYWEEKEECFVTSVDTIYLLEQLVAAHFTVEEKNRIRRNLEHFRPLTVSKGKPESEEFFKVIMGFPTPKPRNIEKDVKVFHWKDLDAALKKIIGKYVSDNRIFEFPLSSFLPPLFLSLLILLLTYNQSASPSSILPAAPPLLTPSNSTGYAAEGSSAGISYMGDHHGTMSPRLISGSTTSTAYATSIPARVLSPHSQKSLAMAQGPSDLRVSSIPHNPHEASHWQPGAHHMQSSHQYAHLGAQNSRGSWDMPNYITTNPGSAGGTSNPQSLNAPTGNSYPRNNVADSAVSGADNQLSRSLSQQQSHQMSLSRT